jgi:hypothetical protein
VLGRVVLGRAVLRAMWGLQKVGLAPVGRVVAPARVTA